MNLNALVLAAGKGTRMKSNLPKVLHEVNGKTMLECVVAGVRGAGVENIILVVGHGSQEVKAKMGEAFPYVLQKEQFGTGHAVLIAADELSKLQGDVLVVCGDTPLLTAETLKALYQEHQQQNAACTILTAKLSNPFGYGRIVRSQIAKVEKIVEEKDASTEEKQITEINTGSYCFKIEELLDAVKRLTPANAQGEYYLTDVIADFNNRGKIVTAYVTPNFNETLGINSKSQLAEAAAILRARKLRSLMDAGVTIIDPQNTYIEEDVEIGTDTVIYPMCFLEGKTKIAAQSNIGPSCRIKDSEIGNDCHIQFSVLTEAKVGNACNIGPFAYLRPGADLADQVKVGDFTEIKKSFIDAGSKVPHLSYIGDASIGKNVNIGAGTITCNYDGVNKHHTEIGDGAFIGSNTNLVAPVKIGGNAVTGAGSTITREVPSAALAVERAQQKNIENYRKSK